MNCCVHGIGVGFNKNVLQYSNIHYPSGARYQKMYETFNAECLQLTHSCFKNYKKQKFQPNN
jgi:hypothetical protein